jgi:hypothetical protein
VVFGEHVREFGCGDAEGDYECQVEEQLQRSRDSMLLVRITTRHPAQPMRRRRSVRNVWLARTHCDILSRPAPVYNAMTSPLPDGVAKTGWRRLLRT